MSKIMNSPMGVKSGVPERVSISCPTSGTHHDLPKITGNQSYATDHSTYVTSRCQIYEQGLYDDHRISETN